MVKRILVIDDERKFRELEGYEVKYVRSAEIGYALLERHHWNEVWLDHDLGERAKDGTWLVLNVERDAYNGILYDVDTFVIHSANPVARIRMAQGLSMYNVKFIRAEDYL